LIFDVINIPTNLKTLNANVQVKTYHIRRRKIRHIGDGAYPGVVGIVDIDDEHHHILAPVHTRLADTIGVAVFPDGVAPIRGQSGGAADCREARGLYFIRLGMPYHNVGVQF
jgi:hypothetical protein